MMSFCSEPEERDAKGVKVRRVFSSDRVRGGHSEDSRAKSTYKDQQDKWEKRACVQKGRAPQTEDTFSHGACGSRNQGME